MTSNHTNLLDLELKNPRRPDKSIFIDTDIRDGKFVFIFCRTSWHRGEQLRDATHLITPADFSRRWRALERLGWKVTGTRKPRVSRSNPAPRMLKTACKLAAERCDCHPSPLPKTRGKPLKL